MARLVAVFCLICVLGITKHAGPRNRLQTPNNSGKAASPEDQRTPMNSVQSSGKVTSQGGVVVFVDPVTRQIREATPEDIGTLSTPGTPLQATPTQPSFVQGAGGGVAVVLGPEFHVYTVVTKSTDGTLRTDEVTGEKAAQERVLPSQPARSGNGK